MARANGGNAKVVKDVLSKLSIDDLKIKGKRVFIRADFNVPLDDNLRITDDGRIRSTLPTINFAIDEGARVILASHLGRPKGKPDPRYSLAPVAKTAEVRERTVLEDSPRDWARLKAAKVRLLLRSRNLTEYEISRLLI